MAFIGVAELHRDIASSDNLDRIPFSADQKFQKYQFGIINFLTYIVDSKYHLVMFILYMERKKKKKMRNL